MSRVDCTRDASVESGSRSIGAPPPRARGHTSPKRQRGHCPARPLAGASGWYGPLAMRPKTVLNALPERLGGGGDRLVDEGLGVRGRDECGFELATGQV